MANAIPVFPLVGSTSTVCPVLMVPSFSADFTIAPGMRSFTDAVGLKLSNLAIISALQFNSLGYRFSLTKGVWPTKEVMSLAIGMILF